MTEPKETPDRFHVAGHEAPRDPALAGFVGRRRAVTHGWPIADGNRKERRAYAKLARRQVKRDG